jgi:hypothetical protein
MRETTDRELALSAPIHYQLPGESKMLLENVSAISVSARRLRFMTVSYLPLESTIDETRPDGEASDE